MRPPGQCIPLPGKGGPDETGVTGESRAPRDRLPGGRSAGHGQPEPLAVPHGVRVQGSVPAPGAADPCCPRRSERPSHGAPPSTNTHSERSRAPGERRFKHPRARCPENQENALLGCTAESRRPSAASPGRTAVLAGARGRRVTSRGRVPQGPQTLQRHGHRRWHRGSTASGRVVSRPGLRDGAPEHSRRGPLARALA